MKLRLTALALPLILACSSSFAAPVTEEGISFQQALEIVSKAGYQSIHKIEREKNFYEVEAYDAQGKALKFKIDPKTGAMTPMKACHHKHHHKAKHHHKKHHKSTQQTTETAAQ